MSGFCGAGSADFRRTGGLADVGSGASLMAGARSLSLSLSFSFSSGTAASLGRDCVGVAATGGASSGSGFFFTAGGFSGREGSTGIRLGIVPPGAM